MGGLETASISLDGVPAVPHGNKRVGQRLFNLELARLRDALADRVEAEARLEGLHHLLRIPDELPLHPRPPYHADSGHRYRAKSASPYFEGIRGLVELNEKLTEKIMLSYNTSNW